VSGRRVLISGPSVAGPILAYWLHRFGFQAAIVVRGHFAVTRELGIRARYRKARILHPRARDVGAERGVRPGEAIVILVAPQTSDIGTPFEAVDRDALIKQSLQCGEAR
jgi:2-polyprenyl-6-methoxyphenol hydroxylase-like FAD-dependent oxidoreductase